MSKKTRLIIFNPRSGFQSFWLDDVLFFSDRSITSIKFRERWLVARSTALSATLFIKLSNYFLENPILFEQIEGYYKVIVEVD